jgi:phage shock protein A
MAMQRAQDKTAQMQARAGAVDELLASGALDDATIPGGKDDIQAELDRGSANSDVELELAKLKGALPAGAAPTAIAAEATAPTATDQGAKS